MLERNKKIWGIALVLVILIGAVVGYFLFTRSEKKQTEVKDVETITYITQLPFDPASLRSISDDTPEAKEILSMLEIEKTEVVIPPNSKVRLALDSFCLDSLYGVPDDDYPIVFSYEKLDMPLFFEIERYILEHPELYLSVSQELMWNLSSYEQFEFDSLLGNQRDILLEIEPDAKRIVDSYEYYRNISVKNFIFGENLPEETIAQPIPGTELYAKVVDSFGYGETEFVLYNPSSEPQIFSLIKEGQGVLAFVPMGWVKKVSIGMLSFGVVSGKFDISENIIRTPSDSGATVISMEGNQIVLEPKTELSLNELEKMLEQSGSSAFFQLLPEAHAFDPIDWIVELYQRRQGVKWSVPQPQCPGCLRG